MKRKSARPFAIGRSNGAISVVNALVTGMGAAIGIDLECKVRASLLDDKENKIIVESEVEDAPNLIETSAREAMKRLRRRGDRRSLSLAVDSNIPAAVGLKSSSALSIATISAVFDLFSSKKVSNKEILKTSALSSIKSGASITGAYDDACACLLGGLVLTDNKKFKLVKRSRLDTRYLGSTVLIRIPVGEVKLTSSVSRVDYSRFKREVTRAFEYAKSGKIAEAMMLNSIVQCTALGYSFAPIEQAAKGGASAVGLSGKGPAVAAICKGEDIAKRIEEAWLSHGERIRIIRSKVSSKPA